MYDIKKTDALIVVDVQKDFCPGGALAVNEGDQVVLAINALTPRFQHVVFTRDWHPANHCSFSDDPKYVHMSWPVHCVADTEGAEYHPDLNVPDGALQVRTATDPEKEAYSGFQGTGLARSLHAMGVQRVFVCGLATDYCVKHTALDAIREGFEVVVLADACRAVDVPPGNGDKALEEMRHAGAAIADSKALGS